MHMPPRQRSSALVRMCCAMRRWRGKSCAGGMRSRITASAMSTIFTAGPAWTGRGSRAGPGNHRVGGGIRAAVFPCASGLAQPTAGSRVDALRPATGELDTTRFRYRESRSERRITQTDPATRRRRHSALARRSCGADPHRAAGHSRGPAPPVAGRSPDESAAYHPACGHAGCRPCRLRGRAGCEALT
jgi:hypothetical protein